MTNPTLAHETSACDGQVSVPRFRAIYLLPWIVVTAVLLTAEIVLDQMFGRIDVKLGPWTTTIFHIVKAAMLGATMTAAGILVRYSASVTFRRLQPGHWLVINSAAASLLWSLFDPFWRAAGKDGDLLMASGCVLCLVSSAIFWFATTRLSETESWKGAFRIFALANLFGAFAVISILLPSATPSIFLSLLGFLPAMFFVICAVIYFLYAVVADIHSKRRRDWLHWLGVVVVAASPLISMAWKIARHFSLP